jgi:hypothetical protein
LSTRGSMKKVEYKISFVLYGRRLNRIIIDQHYKKKHHDVNDEIILELIKTLDPDDGYTISKQIHQFQYFRVEPLFYRGKSYRLILMFDVNEDYLGVINAFRVRTKI